MSVYRVLITGLLMSAMTLLLACGGSSAKAENKAPSDWTESTLREHNITLYQAHGPGDKTTASLLQHYEYSMPLVAVDLNQLADGALSALGLTITDERSVQDIPSVIYREFSATQKGGPVHEMSLIALAQGTTQHVMIFAALPKDYNTRGGTDFMVKRLSQYESVDALKRAQDARELAMSRSRPGDEIAKNKAGLILDGKTFAMGVELLEMFSGVRLTAEEIKDFRRDIVAEWEQDDSADDGASQIAGLYDQFNAAAPYRRLRLVETVLAAGWLEEKKTGKHSVFLTTIDALNPVLAHKGNEVLTERAREARLRTTELYYDWSGVPKKDMTSKLADARKKIPGEFKSMSDNQRKYLSKAQSRGFVVWSWSVNYSPKQKQGAVAAAGLWSSNSPNPVHIGAGFEFGVYFKADQTTSLQAMGMMMVLPDLQNARVTGQ